MHLYISKRSVTDSTTVEPLPASYINMLIESCFLEVQSKDDR